MLSSIEIIFVRILRVTVVATASLAIFVSIGALLFAGYAHFSPEPAANLARGVQQLRQAVDPVRLLTTAFPKDSTIYKEVNNTPDNVSYKSVAASDEEIFRELNKFLDVAFGASFQSQAKFSEWLYGPDAIAFRWSSEIDDKKASNENNVDYLWRSLLFDYAKRLSARADTLAKARKQNLYEGSFETLTGPTGISKAPYFLVWYFAELQNELQSKADELLKARAAREALRLTETPSLIVATSAFGYFLIVIFCFLLISIEASVRRLAELGGIGGFKGSSHIQPNIPSVS